MKGGSSHFKKTLNDWTPLAMELAVAVAKEDRRRHTLGKRIGVRKISEKLKVPRATLNNRVIGKVKGYKHMSGGENQMFTVEEEQELVTTIKNHSNAGFPFTSAEVRELAYEFAVESGKDVTVEDRREDKLSRHWFDRFLSRNKELNIKVPQQLSVYRASCCNRVTVKRWMDFVKTIFDKYDIVSAMQVWNLDETGLVDVAKMRKVVGVAGQKANQIVPKEKGETTTVVVMGNAAGLKVPPLVIHKGKRIQPDWLLNKHDAHVAATETGWINKDLVVFFGTIFLSFLKANCLDGVTHVIFMDGHSAHTYNYRFLKLMKENGIVIINLPPHSSHFLQPLDGAPFAVMKNSWKVQLYHWIRKKAGRALLKKE